MKKFLIGLVVLVALALAAILIGPSFVDWNKYKPEIAGAAREATGRELVIDGDISLSILPAPTLSVEKVRFANAAGGSVADMATLESLDVRVALLPLLQKQVVVENVTLVRPVVVLEKLADGSVNWQFAKGGAAETGEAAGEAPPPISLDRLTIEDGIVIYKDAAAGTEERIEALNAEITAGSLTGPFEAVGSATLRGTPATFDAKAGKLAEGEPTLVDMSFGLPGADATLVFAGNATLDPAGAKVTGKLKAEGSNLAKLIAATTPGSSGEATGLLAQEFSLESEIDATPAGGAIKNIALRLGDLAATGAIDVMAGPPLSTKAKFDFGPLDLDKLMASFAGTGEGATEVADAPKPYALPTGILADIEVTAPTLIFRGGVMENTHVAATLADGVLTLTDGSTILPGGASVLVDGVLAPADGQPRFAGKLKIGADNLRAVLDWLQVKPAGVSSERLRNMSLAANFAVTPAQLDVTELDAVLDASKITGGATVAFPGSGGRTKPGFGVGLAIDRLNLDGYVAAPAEGAPAETGAKAAGLPLGALAPLAAFDANVELRVGSLTFNKETAKGMHLDALVQEGTLTLRDFSIKDFAGGSGKVSGTVTDLAGKPRFDTAIDVGVKDTTRLLQFAGMAEPPAKLGALKLGGTLAGGADDVAYDLAFSIAGIGAQGLAKGKASGLGAGIPRVDSDFEVSAKDAGPLLAIAGMPSVKGLGALSLKGKAASGTDDLNFDVTASLSGVQGTASLAGTVTGLGDKPQVNTRLNVVAKKPAPLLQLAGLGGGAAAKLGEARIEGTLIGGTDRMQLDLNLGGFGATAAVKGSVAAAAEDKPVSFDLDLQASHPELRQLIAMAAPDYKPAAGKLGAFKIATLAKGTTDAASLTNLSVEIGQSRIAGTVEASLAGRPNLVAKLNATALDLDALMPAPGKAAPAKEGPRWSNEPLELAALDSGDADIDFTADFIKMNDGRFDDVKAKVTLKDGTLTISQFSAKAFGGSLDATGSLAGRGVPALAARVDATNVRIEEAMKGGIVASQVKGPVSLQADIAGSGVSMAQLIRNLGGQGNLGGTIKISGTGEQVAGSMLLGLAGSQLQGLTGSALAVSPIALANQAFTMFVGSTNQLSGDFTIDKGVLDTANTRLVNDRAEAQVHGDADIAAWTMNMIVDVLESGGNPYLTVSLTGPMDGPDIGVSGNAAEAAGAAGTGALGGIIQQVVPGVVPESVPDLLPGVLPSVLPGAEESVPAQGGLGGIIQQVVPGLGNTAPEPATAPGAAGIVPEATVEPESTPEETVEELVIEPAPEEVVEEPAPEEEEQAAPGAGGLAPGAQGTQPGADAIGDFIEGLIPTP